jgi:DNA polymerase III subunit gamma/tau
MAYQSLYRRYRPQKFSEIRGQPHIVGALRNAVAKNEVGHAYLFHGPRGTGKTTSARVLAKALNCTDLGADSEPCGTCESCVSIEEGRSFDLHELDAASNNGVDDMRDLLAKVNLGTPGNMKVYILDEVHMLTRGAENALLKTLEEPPDHVVWVLATTEPHKVVQTIRSRCQVFELGLLGAEEMAAHVRWIIDDAGLDVDDAAVDHVVSVGGGSARDTLSALDRVVAAGGVVEIDESTDLLLSSLADREAAIALAAVGDALGRGKDPRTIGEAVLAGLRDAFLTSMGSAPPRLTPSEQVRADDIAGRMTPAMMTRALDVLGTALVGMRQAPDPRVDLEVALVRLCRADADRSIDSLVERLDSLEMRLAGKPDPSPPRPEPAARSTPPEAAPTAAVEAPAPPPLPSPEAAEDASTVSEGLPAPPTVAAAPREAPAAPRASGPAAAARAALADRIGRPAPPIESVTEPVEPAPPTMPPTAVAPASVEEPGPAEAAVDATTDLASFRPASPREVVGLAATHLSVDKDVVVARANELLGPARGSRSADDLTQLWLALVAEFAGPTAAAAPTAIVESASPVDPTPGEAAPESIDLDDLVDAPARTEQIIERLTEAFPGAEVHTPEEPTE